MHQIYRKVRQAHKEQEVLGKEEATAGWIVAMIKYKCGGCGAKLETENSLSGQQERCPACGKLNSVPSSRGRTAGAEARHKPGRKVREKDEAMQALRKLRQDAGGDGKQDASQDAPQATLQEALEQAQQSQARAGGAAVEQASAGGRRTARPPIRASRTEAACGVLGWVCITLGFVGPLVFLAIALRLQYQAAGIVAVVFAVSAPAGIVGGVFWFAVQQVLRYLRMSVNSTNRLRS